MSLAELAQAFDTARLHKAPARYDEAQLHYWQKEAVLQGLKKQFHQQLSAATC